MRTLKFILAFSLLSILLIISVSVESPAPRHEYTAQQGNLRVLNRNTGKSYATMQEAINAPETSDDHEIFVASGTYYEHVTINKSLSLVGEDRSTTIIDGNGIGKVIYVTANNVEISGFTIQNGAFGLWLDKSQNSKIIGNKLQNGSYGIRLYHTKNSQLIGNDVSKYTFFGIELDSSGNSTLRKNSLTGNEYNFGVDGKSLWDFINDIDASNAINGKSIRYLINQHDITVDSSTFQEIGYLGLVNSTHIRVQNLDVQDNIQGLLFAFAVNSTVSNVNAKNNWNGIYVAHSQNISAIGNHANNNFDYGIKFFNSSRSLAKANNLDNNGWAGIGLFGSPNSTVDGNEASFNTYDIHMVYTNSSVIIKNTAQSKPGGYSIAVYYSHNNLIYHNTFTNSLLYIESRNGKPFIPRNSWDDGSEGNYWSLYTGADVDRDGVGDKPFVVGENNVDNHPLMGKFSDFVVSLEGKTYSITVVSNSTISQFQFSPEDGKVSFIAAGFNGTMGFSRIAFPNALIQDLHKSSLTFLINGEQPFLQRKWTDEIHTYLYFSYANSVSGSVINPLLIAAVASIFLIAGMLFFVVYKKKHGAGFSSPQKKSILSKKETCVGAGKSHQ